MACSTCSAQRFKAVRKKSLSTSRSLGSGRAQRVWRKAKEEQTKEKQTKEEQTKEQTKEVKTKKDQPNGKQTKEEQPQWHYTFYQLGDGHESDPDQIPNRYMKVQKGNRAAAKAAMEKTKSWREENDIDGILARPHPKFDQCKTLSPHFFAGRDSKNNIIFYQSPAVVDLKRATKNDVTSDDLLMNYVYVLEYCWNILEEPRGPPTEEKPYLMTSIIDLTGLNLSLLRKRKLIGFIGKFVSTIDAHFPGRGYKTMLLNAPQWFGTLYKLITPILRDTTREKIAIYSRGKEQTQALEELLGTEATKFLPKRCFEKDVSNQPPPMSDMEQGLRNFVLARLEESGVEMYEVV